MPLLIPGTNDAHTLTTLTDAVNTRPYQPTGISMLPWAASGVQTRSVLIDRRAGVLDIVDEAPWNGRRERSVQISDYETISLPVPHHPTGFTVMASEVAGRREMGSEFGFELPQARLNEHLDQTRRNVSFTWEFGRVGALLGKIVRRSGATSVNLRNVFNAGPSAYAFSFATSSANFFRFIDAVKREQRNKLGEFAVTGWRLYAPDGFYDLIRYHASVQKAYDRYQDGLMLRGGNAPFVICENVEVVNYQNAQIPDSGGRMVFPADRCIMVPLAEGLYQTRFAPAETWGTVNTPGLPIYLSPEDLPHGRGVEVEGETNVVHYLRRPEAVAQIFNEDVSADVPADDIVDLEADIDGTV